MKHELTNKLNFSNTVKVCKEVIEKTHSEFNTNDTQLQNMINPIIGNAQFTRVNKELENERFTTLIKLARVLDDETMTKVINGLGYSLNA